MAETPGPYNRRVLNVVNEVVAEREAQHKKWGEQNHPNIDSDTYLGLVSSDEARDDCNLAAAEGRLTWAHILVEEVAEACDSPTETELREELVQVAAVAVAWIEAIDRRAA